MSIDLDDSEITTNWKLQTMHNMVLKIAIFHEFIFLNSIIY